MLVRVRITAASNRTIIRQVSARANGGKPKTTDFWSAGLLSGKAGGASVAKMFIPSNRHNGHQ